MSRAMFPTRGMQWSEEWSLLASQLECILGLYLDGLVHGYGRFVTESGGDGKGPQLAYPSG
jgi:hypothetical protein